MFSGPKEAISADKNPALVGSDDNITDLAYTACLQPTTYNNISLARPDQPTHRAMERLFATSSRRLSTLGKVAIRPNGGVCLLCRAHRATRTRSFSSSSSSSKLSQQHQNQQFRQNDKRNDERNDGQNDKPYYVTTPIFYVNACKTPPVTVSRGGATKEHG